MTTARRGYRYPFPSGHACHHPSCDVPVPPSLLACRPHWYMLPQELRDEIWRTYRKGQDRDKRPSLEYLATVEKCQEFWKAKSEIQGKLPMVGA